MKLIALNILNVIIVSNSFQNNNDSLLAVIQIFRHGERTPLLHYPTDPYADESFWDGPPMELTNEGKRESYLLGQYTRKRYDGFLPKKYSRKHFRIYTTDCDRTHMSAQAYVAGLFPPVDSSLWKKDLEWQPIPIRPISRSVLNDFTGHICPTYLKEWDTVLNNSLLKIIRENSEVIDIVNRNAGYNVTSLYHLTFLFDTLNLDTLFEYSLPEWARLIYPEPLKTFQLLYYDNLGFSKRMRKLVTGPILNEIIKHFKKVNDSFETEKFIVYAAHETNIVPILKTLGYQDKMLFPEFACSLYFELRKGNDQPYLNIYFKNKKNVLPVTVSGCGFDCHLNRLETILQDYIIDSTDFEKECVDENNFMS